MILLYSLSSTWHSFKMSTPCTYCDHLEVQGMLGGPLDDMRNWRGWHHTNWIWQILFHACMLNLTNPVPCLHVHFSVQSACKRGSIPGVCLESSWTRLIPHVHLQTSLRQRNFPKQSWGWQRDGVAMDKKARARKSKEIRNPIYIYIYIYI